MSTDIRSLGSKIGSTLCGAIALAHATLVPADTAREAQNALSEWISVEKQISKDRSDWASEKEVLLNSIAFMKEESERLKEAIETAEQSASAGEKKRQELEERRRLLDAAGEAMEKAVGQYEARIRALAATWPAAFVSQIDRIIQRIPSEEKAAETPLTVRLQNLVAILSQFEKFQSMITKETGVQEVEGTSREVTTLYFGFAYAYFVDSAGQFSGYGYPTDEGWKWESDEALAPSVTALVAIHDRSVDASFVSLPAKIVTP